ncbi:thiamine pyrophosphate enzyme, C-terminal TPP binding domain protein [Brucella pseudogrignonensis]|uniref:2-oxoglutarate dehydrogenase E1 component n=1 Tax=Brucella pseudogrignonensis TaxID=419475 RepID=A0A256G383_9HYPH|nr:thiamine pyrophosphate enzyme, C-terminal TPP binding domain protein [Brucella pseudogrignonensis]
MTLSASWSNFLPNCNIVWGKDLPAPLSGTDVDFLIHAYERIYRIRQFEQSALDLSTTKDALIAGSVHLCAGQEAVPVGAMAGLGPDDRVIATYRGHGWALETGVPELELFAELCHRKAGVNGGRSGSALVTAPNERFIGENSIVGAGGPVACGVAMAAQLDGADRVCVVTFGDGATSQGALHEAFVFASAYKLPVIFVCENNGWSEMTPTQSITGMERLARRASAYGMQSATIDGTDPLIVRDSFAIARAAAIAGKGPILIECQVPRLWGHYNRDIEHYRPKANREESRERDPLRVLEARLCDAGVSSPAELSLLQERLDRDWAAILEKVRVMPAPDVETAADHVVEAVVTPPADPNAHETGKKLTYIQAVNEALKRELTERGEVLVYGEDVGHSGGIFGASRYLQRDFGASRVFDTPIAEAAILGSAVGLALEGKRPVVEIMWADFLLVALDQIINQAANVRYLTRGTRQAPIVVRVQQGATPGSTAQHSQSLEGMLAHVPGLRIGLPSTPDDAYHMLRAAIAGNDPSVIIESRALYQHSGEVRTEAARQSTSGAALRRSGDQMTLVGWGAVMPAIEAAADELELAGISVSVLDLRWLAPVDWERLCTTVTATGGRVVVVHEANLTGGFGAEIVAGLAERLGPAAIGFRRVATPDVRMPASPVLQAALLPGASKIVAAAQDLLRSNEQPIREEYA